MSDGFVRYARTNVAEMRPWTPDVSMEGVSLSKADLVKGSPKDGDMIARNPLNHDDMWLVARDYFKENFVLLEGEGGLPSSREYDLMALLATFDEFAPDDFEHEDDMDVEDFDCNVTSWFEHWRKHLPSMAEKEHHGDCTKEPCACLRCHHDELLARVRRVL